MEQPKHTCSYCHTDIIIPLAAIRLSKNGDPLDMEGVTIKLEVECPSCGSHAQANWVPAKE